MTRIYAMYVKRMIDVIGAILGLILLFPFLMLLALAIRICLGRPILFRQLRPGLHGKPFPMYKFRTMSDLTDEFGNALPDEKRMTKIGNFLRRTSLDELPELLNVLRGEMSLVGPRPLLMQYLDRYTADQMRRHELRPGITGWAQVNGRNRISWESKFELDLWYVDNCSLWLDVQILGKTLRTVFRREGIHAERHVTMPEFQGASGKNGEHD